MDKEKEARCKLIHTIVEETINIAVNTAIGVLTDGIGSGITSVMWKAVGKKIKPFVKDTIERLHDAIMPTGARKSGDSGLHPVWSKIPNLWKDMGKAIASNSAGQLDSPIRHIPQNSDKFLKWQEKEFPYSTQEDANLRNTLVNDAYKAWPRNKLYGNPNGGLRRGGGELPTVIGGQTSDSLCSAFEGDWQDLNPKNTRIVDVRMSKELADAQKQVHALFEEITKGAAPEVGAPSMTARWMLARAWIGEDIPGTVEYDLHFAEQFDR